MTSESVLNALSSKALPSVSLDLKGAKELEHKFTGAFKNVNLCKEIPIKLSMSSKDFLNREPMVIHDKDDELYAAILDLNELYHNPSVIESFEDQLTSVLIRAHTLYAQRKLTRIVKP